MTSENQTGLENPYPILEEYLQLESKFEKPPFVQLELISTSPDQESQIGLRDVAVSTAIQCNSADTIKFRRREDPKSLAIAVSTLKAGHHTTRQHNNYTWKLAGVSKSLVHDVFHAHPFYNSEQQSQRSIRATQGNILIPSDLSTAQRAIYIDSTNFASSSYIKLINILIPKTTELVYQTYPTNSLRVETTTARLASKIRRTAQEVARYVLPLGQKTTLDYTLSALQLLRLFRASQMPHFTDEARFVLARMISEVAQHDQSILYELDSPLLPLEYPYTDLSSLRNRYDDFDERLKGQNSKLLSIPNNARELLVETTSNIFGFIAQGTEAEILSLLLDPSQNKLLNDVYECGILDPLTSSLRTISITYATKLSHAADSQRQRHRRTPGVTPPLKRLYTRNSDYITPKIIRTDPGLNEEYKNIMGNIYDNVEKALDSGIPEEYSLLLLPNAQAVRTIETGDLFDWIHRWKQRLCFLAQEEIFSISLEQAIQLKDFFPEAEKLLLAPCGIRQASHISPRCPEGYRWCGSPVFNWTLDKYSDSRLL